jgi:capsular polysaccharide biosynthesis protein
MAQKQNNIRTWLLKPPSQEDVQRVLKAWRLYLIGALLGGGLAWAIYGLFPPPYQAQATVIVDHNLEESFPRYPDREVFYFLERETEKLVEIAWSDSVLQSVVDQQPGMTLTELRGDKLVLSQPADGGWHFVARDQDPAKAEALAALWARAFVDKVQSGVQIANQIDLIKNNLKSLSRTAATSAQRCERIYAADKSFSEVEEQLIKTDFQSPYDIWRISEIFSWTRWSGYAVDELNQLSSPATRQSYLQTLKQIIADGVQVCDKTAAPDQAALKKAEDELVELQKQSLGVEPTVLVALSQAEELPVQRAIGRGAYAATGAGLTIVCLMLFFLFVHIDNRQK